ncbi:uncharacterized protein A1O9_13093 [Exophiala aquamarina CBS 119918]|uniref:Uncharacterized protein n=1 Tax=Exophiala aquamarina CBS 119918 TaxID=1182545 RepID=A0A072NTB6_9EURO|nr:uncharacterized protein A1O9_13093 [Exophiala aquamarina CBS 119918]KEF50856.1 hypothetical protein A1O9_13093 [Exophiala aquamarina CBS 119918]
MAAAPGVPSRVTSNRFAPLSSPKSSTTSSRGNSRTRSDASPRPRSASPTTSQSTEYYGIVERLETYPSTWAHTKLPPQQLATCGFSYKESRHDTCICHVCGEALRVRRAVTTEEWTNEEVLSIHAEDCVLADIIYDLIYNASYIYTVPSPSRPQMPEVMPPTSSCTSPPGELPSTKPTAATPILSTCTENPAQKPTSSPPSPSPSRLSYANHRIAPMPDITIYAIKASSTLRRDITDADNESYNDLLPTDPLTGEVTDRAILEYLHDEVRNGELVRVIDFTKVDPSISTYPPPEWDKRLYETFKWKEYVWTKQLIGDDLPKEYTLRDWERLVQKQVKNQPPYDVREYVCHDLQEGIRRDIGLRVPPDTIRTTLFRKFGRPIVGTLIKSSNASAPEEYSLGTTDIPVPEFTTTPDPLFKPFANTRPSLFDDPRFKLTPTSIFSPDYPHPEHFKDAWQTGLQRANIKSPGDLVVAVGTMYAGAALSAMTSGAVSLAPGAGGGITLAINLCNPVGQAGLAGIAVVAGCSALYQRRQNRLRREAALHVQRMIDNMEPARLPQCKGQIWIFVADEHGTITIFQGYSAPPISVAGEHGTTTIPLEHVFQPHQTP